MKLFRKPIFVEAIGDEVLLAQKARRQIETTPGLLDKKTLLKLTREQGIDFAARCFYESLMRSEHGRFKRAIDSLELNKASAGNRDQAGKIKLIIIPGMFYIEHPEVGADGKLILSIAKQCGFNAELLAVESKGSMAANVKIIEHYLQQDKAVAIWILSLSKGSAEVQRYLQSCDVPESVKGWLNIAGINQGSPHAARKISSSMRKVIYKLLCRMFGVDYAVLVELDPAHDHWNCDRFPHSIECIHVVPIPLQAHLQSMLMSRYRKLKQYGPNDGIVPIVDVCALPGSIYPVWGVDHFMRTPDLSVLLYKFLTYIRNQNKSE
ncbi:MAG: hypothetical protein H8E21_07275 [Gammaproteobacteria bacterium]|nr:hypothetical protein [Gammaproteobacteria bacterium]MBL6999061.1 hypothetical protein [Gammaproteobacteria bacterium]